MKYKLKLKTKPSSRQVVLRVLDEIADKYAHLNKTQITFSKAEFISTYWRLLRQNRIDWIKIETLLRTLRKMAEKGGIVSYHYNKGWYVLDLLMLR